MSSDDEDDLHVRGPPRVLTTPKSVALSGNYFLPRSQYELRSWSCPPTMSLAQRSAAAAAAGAAEVEPGSGGLHPLDVAWFLDVFAHFASSSTLSADELAEAVRFFGLNPLGAQLEQTLKASSLATDELHFGDFLRVCELLPPPSDALNECFRVFDPDGTGRISRGHLAGILRTSGMRRSELQRMPALADRKGDGHVESAELIAQLTDASGRATQRLLRISDQRIEDAVLEAAMLGFHRLARPARQGSIRAAAYVAVRLPPRKSPPPHARAAARASGVAEAEVRAQAGGSSDDDRGPSEPIARRAQIGLAQGNGLLLGTGHAIGRLRIGAAHKPRRTADSYGGLSGFTALAVVEPTAQTL